MPDTAPEAAVVEIEPVERPVKRKDGKPRYYGNRNTPYSLADERVQIFVREYGLGQSKRQSAILAGFSASDATKAADRMLAHEEIRDACFEVARLNGVKWRSLLELAKRALHDNLRGESKGGATVKASDRNTAAKIVIDSLKGIDKDSLNERARSEDSKSDLEAAIQILGDHGLPQLESD